MADANDLMRRIARVGADIDPALTDRDVERLVEGARVRRRRRTVARVGLGAMAAGAAAIAAVVVMHGRPPGLPGVSAPGGVATPAVAAPAPLRLADGSVATPLDQASALVVREDAPRRVAIDLARGRGHFDVAPRPERAFAVHAGDVTITVIGTVFTVERVADRIGVSVTRGKVLVDWGVGSRRLAAGESGWFPPLVTAGRGAGAGGAGTGRGHGHGYEHGQEHEHEHVNEHVDGDGGGAARRRLRGLRSRRRSHCSRRRMWRACRGGRRRERPRCARSCTTTVRIRGRRWRRSRWGACC